MDVADLLGLVTGWGSDVPEAAPEPEPKQEPEGTEEEAHGH